MSLSVSRLRKPVAIALVASICVALVVSMGIGVTSPATARKPERKNIGALLPLTGDLASYGNASKAAIELAQKEVNKLLKEAGVSWTLKVLFRDTEGNPDVALTELNRLFNKKGVQFVIGPLTSAEVLGIKDYADDNEILVVSQASTLPALAIADDFIFRFVPADSMAGRAIARLMYNDTISKVVAVYRNDWWGTELLDATETSFEALTGKDFTEKMSYDPGVPDFPALAAELNMTVVEDGADGVLYIGFAEAVDFFTVAMGYSDLWNVKWYGSDGTALNEELITNETVREFCSATGFINPLFSPTRSDKYDRVHDALFAQLGREPDPYAYMAYDIVWALTYSLSLVNRYDSAAVKAILPEVTECLFGASGWIVLDENGDRIDNYDLWRIVHEELEYKWKHVGTWLYITDSITWFS